MEVLLHSAMKVRFPVSHCTNFSQQIFCLNRERLPGRVFLIGAGTGGGGPDASEELLLLPDELLIRARGGLPMGGLALGKGPLVLLPERYFEDLVIFTEREKLNFLAG